MGGLARLRGRGGERAFEGVQEERRRRRVRARRLREGQRKKLEPLGLSRTHLVAIVAQESGGLSMTNGAAAQAQY